MKGVPEKGLPSLFQYFPAVATMLNDKERTAVIDNRNAFMLPLLFTPIIL
jgi:hypothetical protein